jgi:flagellar biosynthetic protein FliQ
VNLDVVTGLLQETVRTSLIAAGPVLLGALAVGLVISVVQTATQINDQTLAFVPKILTVLMLFGLLFPWIMGTLLEFARRMFEFAAQRGGP